MSLRIDQVGGDAGLTERDLVDLVALRLTWKPAASADDDAAFVDGFRDWWGSEGDRRRAWLARHTSGYAVGMANENGEQHMVSNEKGIDVPVKRGLLCCGRNARRHTLNQRDDGVERLLSTTSAFLVPDGIAQDVYRLRRCGHDVDGLSRAGGP